MITTTTLRRHGRFLLSFLFGLVLATVTAFTPLDLVMQTVTAVNGFFVCYLTLTGWMALRISAENLRRHAEADDEGAALIFILAVAAVGVSLFSIFMVLNRASDSRAEALFALAAAPLGWAVLHVLAAFRYAHLYYNPDPIGGLEFPGEAPTPPGIMEFLYFSFVIGMTAQVSDVEVSTSRLRKVVLVHSIGAFFYNTVILALAVNAALALSK
jgi:uncharacterized membrane protein